MARKKVQVRGKVKKVVDGVIRTVNPAKKAVREKAKVEDAVLDKEGRNERKRNEENSRIDINSESKKGNRFF
jgi:hypothetical protein